MQAMPEQDGSTVCYVGVRRKYVTNDHRPAFTLDSIIIRSHLAVARNGTTPPCLASLAAVTTVPASTSRETGLEKAATSDRRTSSLSPVLGKRTAAAIQRIFGR